MKKSLKAYISFFRLTGKMKREAILIMISYLQVSCLVRYFPLRKYYPKYFLHSHPEPFDFAPYKNDLSLIKRVIRQMPGNHTCLKESIIVHLTFKRKGLYIPLYLGVNTEDEFLAHAWYDQYSSKGYKPLNA